MYTVPKLPVLIENMNASYMHPISAVLMLVYAVGSPSPSPRYMNTIAVVDIQLNANAKDNCECSKEIGNVKLG